MATVNFSEQVNNFATRVGAECKRISNTIGALSSLNTTDKTSVVNAIAEVKTATATLQNTLNSYATELNGVKTSVSTNTGDLTTLKSSVSTLQSNLQALQNEVDGIEGVLESQSEIDDTKVTAVTTYSSSKVESVVATAKQEVKDELLGGAGTAFDTLKELADLIGTNGDAIESLTTLASNTVKYVEQTLTDDQKTQARTNIGAASASVVSGYGTRLGTVETKASTTETNLSTLTTNIGDTTTNFVATFESALVG